MTIKPDFIGEKVLVSNHQIAQQVPELRRHFGSEQWVSTQDIMAYLKMTNSKSASTMVGHAMRADGTVLTKRTMKGRLFLFAG